jgi:hypothetical protein
MPQNGEKSYQLFVKNSKNFPQQPVESGSTHGCKGKMRLFLAIKGGVWYDKK